MTSQNERAIISAITAHITSRLTEWFGQGAVLTGQRPEFRQLRRSFFIHYRVHSVSGGPKCLLIKVPRRPEKARLAQTILPGPHHAATQREYESLERIWVAFGQDGSGAYCVIRPLEYLPSWNAIAMEALEARSLKEALLRPRIVLGLARDWERIESAFERAAGWLGTFHERLGDRRPEYFPVEEARTEITQALDRLASAASRQIDLEPLRQAFAHVLDTLRGSTVPTATLHGDFYSSNILLTASGQVGAFDTKRLARGPVYVDLAALITDPVTRKIQVLSQGLFIRDQWLEGCQAATLRGYFGPEAWDRRALDLYCGLAVVRKWALDEEMMAVTSGLRRLAAYLAAPWVRRYFGQACRRYLELEINA